jgi:hypothetical protein
MFGGFFMIAGGGAFGGVAMLLGRFIAALGGFRMVLNVWFGRGLCVGCRHDMSPVFLVSLFPKDMKEGLAASPIHDDL